MKILNNLIPLCVFIGIHTSFAHITVTSDRDGGPKPTCRDTIPPPSYPFVLPDTAGNLIKAEDFEGKLVVMEFWFRGCIPCISLAKSMRPIIDHFSDRDDIVFIDVNLDKSKETWLKGLSKGDLFYEEVVHYSHPNSISLGTHPLGFNHPMAQYYGIKGAPVLIIIGKKGEILDRNPPRPRLLKNNNIKESIQMLESYLTN